MRVAVRVGICTMKGWNISPIMFPLFFAQPEKLIGGIRRQLPLLIGLILLPLSQLHPRYNTFKPRRARLFHPFTHAVINFANFRGPLLAFDTRAIEGWNRWQLRLDYYLLLSHTQTRTHTSHTSVPHYICSYSPRCTSVCERRKRLRKGGQRQKWCKKLFLDKQQRSVPVSDFNILACCMLAVERGCAFVDFASSRSSATA